MKKKIIIPVLLFVVFCSCHVVAQLPMTDFNDFPPPVVSKETKTENRQKLYKSLVNGINRNLSLPLTDSTEENWMDAFYSIELLRYRSPWTEGRVHAAFNGIEKRGGVFQRSLMELVYDAYPNGFEKEVKLLSDSTLDAKCFAIGAEYLFRNKQYAFDDLNKVIEKGKWDSENPVIKALLQHFRGNNEKLPPLNDLLHHKFFSNNKLVFSFQRRNRNYPGIAVIRDSTGNFVKDTYGNIFSVPQLARSISNLPGYLSNGNTPQGIFRMYGFDVSKSIFIGPTQNIQLTMPGETSIRHFFNDSTITDSVWTEDWYRRLLPAGWKGYMPFFETYYAGKAGRTEIIAHGTTVDPGYYKGTPYYPLTPTLGCLCTKELWDEENGTRKISDQQKLVDVLKKAGGADGYYIVIELNDEQRAVDLKDVLPYLK